MKLTNPSLTLTFVGSSTIPVTTITSADIVRESIELDWQMMNDLKSSSDKGKISINKSCSVVEKILSFDGDIKFVLKDDTTTLFTGFLGNKYTWQVTDHGMQALSLTLEDNTRLLECTFSDADKFVKEPFYKADGTGFLRDILEAVKAAWNDSTAIQLATFIPPTTEIVTTVPADTQCVDILDRVCYELGYCYKFNNEGKLFMWKIAKDDESAPTVVDKQKLYTSGQEGLNVKKSLKQYNRSVVKYTEVKDRSNVLIYQDISGQDDTHPNCYIKVAPGYAYPSGLTLVNPDTGKTRTDEELQGLVDVTDLDEGKTILGIGSNITTEFSCDYSGITATIKRYSATQLSVLIKNNMNVPIYILKLRARGNITYEDAQTKIYAGESVTDKKLFDAELEYLHNKTSASEFANLTYQFYKHSNLVYTFHAKEKLEMGTLVQLKEDVYSGATAKVLINARVEKTSTDIYDYVAYSYSPFKLDQSTTGSSSQVSPSVVPGKDGVTPIIQYAIGDSKDYPPLDPAPFGVSSSTSLGNSSSAEFGVIDDGIWSPVAPTPVPEGKYLWMRTSTDNGNTWSYSRLTGEQGEQGEPGKDGNELRFELNLGRLTFVINRRKTKDTDIQKIYCNTIVVGYKSPTVVITTEPPDLYKDGYLKIPYNNSYETITVRGVLVDTSTETPANEIREVVLTSVDETGEPEFLGCLSYVPTKSLSELALIDGDYWCVKSDFGSYKQGEVYRYFQGVWVKLDADTGTVTELITCLRAFKKEGIDFGNISDPNAISWFAQIVADTIVVEKLKGETALFKNLIIDNTATFKGTIESDPITSIISGSSQKTYESVSSSTGGGAFKWEEVKSYIISNKSPSSEVFYTASGKVNGKTPSKAVYFSSLSGNRFVTNGTEAETLLKEVEICTATYPSKYRITATMTGGGSAASWIGYRIYSGTTVDKSGYVVRYNGSATITTPVVQTGQVLKLVMAVCGMTYNVYEYFTDNFDTGINVICTDGTIFNIGNSGAKETISYLTGVGSDLKLVCGGNTWAQCDSSQWTSGIPRYRYWTGKSGGTASSSGSGAILSGTCSIEFKRPGKSQETYYFGDYASWSSNSLSVASGGSTLFTLTTSTELESWSIDFTVSQSNAGMETMNILPKETLKYNLGSDGRRWSNVYTNNLDTNSFSADEVSADNLYGNLGGTSSSSRGNAWINTLKIYSGLTYGSTNLLTPYNFSSGCLQVPSTGSLSNFKIQYGTISITSDSTTISFGTSFSSSTTYAVAVTYVGSSYIEATPIVTARNSSYCTVKTQGRSSNTMMLWIAIGI